MSNSSNNNTNAASTLVFGLLGIVFVVLKLLGVIDWSWWWVTAPFWLPTAIGLCVLLLLLAFLAVKRK